MLCLLPLKKVDKRNIFIDAVTSISGYSNFLAHNLHKVLINYLRGETCPGVLCLG